MKLTYETRLSQIVQSLNGFLRQFQKPPHLTDEAALTRIRSTAEAINKRLPASLGQEGLGNTVADIFQSVAENHKGSQWPPVELFSRLAGERGRKVTETEDSGDFMLEWARENWRRGKVIAPANTWEIAKVLIAEGADPWEIRNSGFQTDTDYFRNLEAEGNIWPGHSRVMRKIQELNEAIDVEFKEAAE